ncbi:hypothetical protein [Planobispora longispora]|uniref:Uncharacterized protein n=1 Tax=Planobispora longispora TaxID=28887 RepID=A0A8J3W8K4_9ACTN|nr:hypothetical protein [Planobispora longispora]GIH79970.1 hypothetical protein Plo01_63990 [Planobispora longispora]
MRARIHPDDLGDRPGASGREGLRRPPAAGRAVRVILRLAATAVVWLLLLLPLLLEAR